MPSIDFLVLLTTKIFVLGSTYPPKLLTRGLYYRVYDDRPQNQRWCSCRLGRFILSSKYRRTISKGGLYLISKYLSICFMSYCYKDTIASYLWTFFILTPSTLLSPKVAAIIRILFAVVWTMKRVTIYKIRVSIWIPSHHRKSEMKWINP